MLKIFEFYVLLSSFVFELDIVYTIKEHVQMFNIMSLRHHWTKNFSIPALFMPRLLAITAFPGFEGC
jgi:hypothetical protein